jgi:hypothetical protein
MIHMPSRKRGITRRCSGGREAQFLWVLVRPLAAPLNAGVRPLRVSADKLTVMTKKSNKVTMVLDPNFGQKLEAFAIHSHVWAIDTPANLTIAEKYWQNNPEHKPETGITTFHVHENETAAEACLRILDVIDLHHGEYSSTPPYSALEIIGLSVLSEQIKSALEGLGFEAFERTAEGFQSTRK